MNTQNILDEITDESLGQMSLSTTGGTFHRVTIVVDNPKHVIVMGRITDPITDHCELDNWEYTPKHLGYGPLPNLDTNLMLKDIFNKVNFVKELVFLQFVFDEESYHILLEHVHKEKTEIRGLEHLEFRNCSVNITKDSLEFLLCSTKITKLFVKTDCLFSKELVYNEMFMMKPMNLRTNCERSDQTLDFTGLTDEYLFFVLEHPEAKLWISNAKTSFTAKTVLEVIELLIARGDKRYWNFGICLPGDFAFDEMGHHRLLDELREDREKYWVECFWEKGFFTYEIDFFDEDDLEDEDVDSSDTVMEDSCCRIQFQVEFKQ